MKLLNKMKLVGLLLFFVPLVVLTLALFATSPKVVYAATTAVNLLTTENFAVLGHTGVSDVPTSAISGDVGSSSGTSITGLTCSEVTGTIIVIAGI